MLTPSDPLESREAPVANLSTRSAPAWIGRWLAIFRDTGNVSKACKAVGIDRSTPYRYRDGCPEFAQAWRDAEEAAADALEEEAQRRAMEGSDFLMKFLLQSLRPEKYQDRSRHDVLFGKMSESDLDAYIERQLAEAGSGGEDRPGSPALSAGGSAESGGE